MNIATMPKDSSHRRNDIEQPLEEAASSGDADADADKSENTNKTSDSTASVSRKSSKQRMSTGGGSKATTNSRSVVVPLDPSILELVSKMDESLALDDEDDDEYRRRCCRNYHHVCCCVADVRRVSLVANSLYMITCVVFIWMVSAPESMGLPEYEDDEFNEFIDSLSAGTIPRSSIGLVMAVIGSVGAYRFQKWLVLAMVVWYVIYFVLAFFSPRLFQRIFAAILLYPTIALFLALHHGRLTKENYAEESRCCSLLHNSKTNYDD